MLALDFFVSEVRGGITYSSNSDFSTDWVTEWLLGCRLPENQSQYSAELIKRIRLTHHIRCMSENFQFSDMHRVCWLWYFWWAEPSCQHSRYILCKCIFQDTSHPHISHLQKIEPIYQNKKDPILLQFPRFGGKLLSIFHLLALIAQHWSMTSLIWPRPPGWLCLIGTSAHFQP